jgi:hypothetical protein
MSEQAYLRGVNDTLAEIHRRLNVASKLGETLDYASAYQILRDTADKLDANAYKPRIGDPGE